MEFTPHVKLLEEMGLRKVSLFYKGFKASILTLNSICEDVIYVLQCTSFFIR
jgi:hypothetical protein